MRSMKVFDPSAPAMVHDHLNDRIFEWSPSWHGAYEKYATEVEPGIISFNGLLLDGWRLSRSTPGQPILKPRVAQRPRLRQSGTASLPFSPSCGGPFDLVAASTRHEDATSCLPAGLAENTCAGLWVADGNGPAQAALTFK
jgi:hypothetical protein